MRNLVTKYWVYVFLGFILGRGGGWNYIHFFGRLLFQGSNVKKRGGHQKKKF